MDAKFFEEEYEPQMNVDGFFCVSSYHQPSTSPKLFGDLIQLPATVIDRHYHGKSTFLLAPPLPIHCPVGVMTRGVIWDLDGTLVDSLHGIALSLNHALGQLGHPLHEVAAIRSFIGNGSYDLSRRAAPPEACPEVVETIETAFKADYATRWLEGTEPYPGMIECVEKLHAAGIRQAVLSNKPHPFTAEIVARIFPAGIFDIVLGQKPEFPKKPEPQAALHVIDSLGITPFDCHFVGDSSVDWETAHRAGIPFLLVGWGYEKAEEAERLAGCERVADAAILTQRLLS